MVSEILREGDGLVGEGRLFTSSNDEDDDSFSFLLLLIFWNPPSALRFEYTNLAQFSSQTNSKLTSC